MNPVWTAYIRSLLHDWTPWVTMGSAALFLYRQVRGTITGWVDKLLDNHLAHLQASMDRMEEKTEDNLVLQRQQIEILQRIAEK